MSTRKSIETVPDDLEHYDAWCGTRRQNLAWDRLHPEVVAQRAPAARAERRRVRIQAKWDARKEERLAEAAWEMARQADEQWEMNEATEAAVEPAPVPEPERFTLEEAYYRLQVEQEAHRRPVPTGIHERHFGLPVWFLVVAPLVFAIWRAMQ